MWDRAITDLHVPVPVTVGRLDEVAARVLGVNAGGALLLRPDGFPIARVEHTG